MRQRGEGKHKQKQLCLTSLLAERRKDWHKACATEQSRKRWKEGKGRGGEGSETAGGATGEKKDRKWVKKMHKSGISSPPPGTNNIVCWVNGSWWSQARGESDEEAGRAQPVLLLSTNPLPAGTQPWHDCREGFRDLFFFFSFRIAEFYAVGRCWRTGFERAVICDWTQCATWSLLCLLLPRLLPSPPPPAVFGLWSWLRGWASPRCVAVTEWKVRPIKSTMGAKQMKWWEPYFSLFRRCCFNVGMMHTAIAIIFFIIFFFCLRCTRIRNNTILWAISHGIIYMEHIWFQSPHLSKCVTNWFKCDSGAFVSAARRFLLSVYNAGGVGVSLCEPEWAAVILPSSRARSRAAP